MMLNIKLEEVSSNFINYIPLGGFIVFLFCLEIYSLFFDFTAINFDLFYFDWFHLFFFDSNLVNIGLVLYTFNFISFILGGFILLVAMFGAILLTLNHRSDVRRQYIFSQVAREVKLFK